MANRTPSRGEQVVACTKCRRRKWVMPSRVGSAQCCGRPMTGAAATATVTVVCPKCHRGDKRLWSLGPSYSCGGCAAPAIVVPGDPSPRAAPSRTGGQVVGDRGSQDVSERPAETTVSVLEAVRSFLVESGISSVLSGSELVVQGERVGVPRFRGNRSLARSVNALVASEFSARLVGMVRDQLGAPRDGLEVHHRNRSPNVEVIYHGRVVAYVAATGWKTPGETDAGSGNFLLPGPHWNRLRSLTGVAIIARIVEAETDSDAKIAAPTAPRPLRPPLRDGDSVVHYDLPQPVGVELLQLAETASRRIRTERSLAFGHVVQLRSRSGFELSFSPVDNVRGRPEMTVDFVEHGSQLRFRLRVSALGDPLPVRVAATANADGLSQAWALALVAFADLTCPEGLEHLREPRGHQHERSPARHPGRSGVSSRSTSVERRVRHPATGSPRTFEPIGETSRWLSSYVAGHRRRLAPGQSASDEAITNATAAGIVLRANETWVSPHTRGIPPDIALHFAWRAPRAARER